jgi:hypothetical protein
VGRGRNGKRAKWECYLGEMGKGEVGKGEMGRHPKLHVTSIAIKFVGFYQKIDIVYTYMYLLYNFSRIVSVTVKQTWLTMCPHLIEKHKQTEDMD